MTDPVTAYCAAYLAATGVAFALLAVASSRYRIPSRKGPTTVTTTPAFTDADERAFAFLLRTAGRLTLRSEPLIPDPPVVEPDPDGGDEHGTEIHVCVRTPDGAMVEATAWLPQPSTAEQTADAVRRCSAGVLAQLAPGA